MFKSHFFWQVWGHQKIVKKGNFSAQDLVTLNTLLPNVVFLKVIKNAFIANLVCSAPYRKQQLINLPILAIVIIATSDDLVTLS